MNRKPVDARKILSDLTKKYCVGNRRKIKSISVSSDDSNEVVTTPVSIKATSSTENASILSVHSTKSSTKTNISANTYEVDIHPKLIRGEGSVDESCISAEKAAKSNSPVDDASIVSVSIVSSVKTDIEEIHSDANDNISEASDSSSVLNVLANVHLISDDVLEEIETNISSDRSNFDYDGPSNRLSVGHSIKSIPLGSPIEPLNLEEYNYKSDFESSDSDECSDESIIIPTTVHTIESTGSHENDISVKVTEHTLGKSYKDISRNTEINNLQSNFSNDILIYPYENEDKFSEKSRTDKNFANNVEEVLSNQSVINIGDEHISLKGDSSDEEFVSKFSKSDESNLIDKSEDVTDRSLTSSIDIIEISIKKSQTDVSSYKSSSSDLSSHQKKIQPTNELHVKQSRVQDINSSSDAGNLEIKKSIFVNKGVQTSRKEKHFKKSSSANSSIYNYNIPRKKFYVKTSVKSTKSRPVVYAMKLNDQLDMANIDFSPYTYREGLSVEELMNEVLRNQITMTKHFMHCHHRLYLQCCQTVQTLNEEYKKNKICFIGP